MGLVSFVRRGGRQLGNFAGDVASDVAKGANSAVSGVTGLYDNVSGASATKEALKKQEEAGKQAGGAITSAYNQGQGLLAPYQQGGAQDYENLRQGVNNGSLSPRYEQFQGPTDFQGGQYQNPGNFQGGQASTNNLGAYSLNGFDPSMPTQPQRQQATTANLDMYSDPGYQFRMSEGLRALDASAAGKGHARDGSGAMNGVMDFAQGMASQEFQNRYDRFNNDQNNTQGDFRDARNFAGDQLNDAYSRFSGDRNFGADQFNMDRNFGRGTFENDRNFGADQFSQNRNFGRDTYTQDRDFNQNAFQDSRNFKYGMNQDQNNWNANDAQNRYNMQNGLVGMGYNAANAGADMATNYGAQQADLYTGLGNARAQAGLTQSNQRRGLFGDVVDTGFKAYDRFSGRGK